MYLKCFKSCLKWSARRVINIFAGKRRIVKAYFINKKMIVKAHEGDHQWPTRKHQCPQPRIKDVDEDKLDQEKESIWDSKLENLTNVCSLYATHLSIPRRSILFKTFPLPHLSLSLSLGGESRARRRSSSSRKTKHKP